MDDIFLLKGCKDIFRDIYEQLINDADINIQDLSIRKVLELIIAERRNTIWDFVQMSSKELRMHRGVGDIILTKLIGIQQNIIKKYYTDSKVIGSD